MITMCREKGLKAVLGDFNKLPFEDHSFDGVWAYTALLHIQKSELSQALKEVRRVLKENGVFGMGMIEGTTEGYRESSGMAESRWFSFYTKTEIEDILNKHHFTLLHFEHYKPRSKNYLNFIFRRHAYP